MIADECGGVWVAESSSPAPAPLPASNASFSFKLPGSEPSPSPPKQAWGATAAGTPSAYERQVDIITKFYAKVDASKGPEDCRGIVDKRRGADDAMSEADFSKLCGKLKTKYKEDPVAVAEAAAAGSGGGSALPAAAVSDEEASFNRQVDTLTKYYAKHDASKSRADCEGIIRKRSGCGDGKSVPVAAADWVKLCGKLVRLLQPLHMSGTGSTDGIFLCRGRNTARIPWRWATMGPQPRPRPRRRRRPRLLPRLTAPAPTRSAASSGKSTRSPHTMPSTTRANPARIARGSSASAPAAAMTSVCRSRRRTG